MKLVYREIAQSKIIPFNQLKIGEKATVVVFNPRLIEDGYWCNNWLGVLIIKTTEVMMRAIGEEKGGRDTARIENMINDISLIGFKRL